MGRQIGKDRWQRETGKSGRHIFDGSAVLNGNTPYIIFTGSFRVHRNGYNSLKGIVDAITIPKSCAFETNGKNLECQGFDVLDFQLAENNKLLNELPNIDIKLLRPDT